MIWEWLSVFLTVFAVDAVWLVGDAWLYLSGRTPVSAYAHDYPGFGLLIIGFQLIGVAGLALHFYFYPRGAM